MGLLEPKPTPVVAVLWSCHLTPTFASCLQLTKNQGATHRLRFTGQAALATGYYYKVSAQITLHPVNVRQGDAGWRLPIRRGTQGAVHPRVRLLREHVLTLSYAAEKNPLRMFVLSKR